jgi:hypothetical protein
MPAAPRSPLDGTGRLIVDGTNLLWRIGGPRGTAAPPAAIIGRIRSAIPPAVTIELVFDGIGHGVNGRVAQQMFVRHSGRQSGDDAILEQAGLEDEAVLVVTDDRGLRETLLARGIRTAPLVWLLARLQMPTLSSVAPGNRRAPIGSGRPPGDFRGSGGAGAGGPGGGDDDARIGWKPGRGATSKTGPMHKIARHKRHPKHA